MQKLKTIGRDERRRVSSYALIRLLITVAIVGVEKLLCGRSHYEEAGRRHDRRYGGLMGLVIAILIVPWSLPAPAQTTSSGSGGTNDSDSTGLTTISGANIVDYTSYPITTLENATSKVMLAISRDHQYFLKAYNDYTDLDDDGLIEEAETTYDNGFEYYGYFDSDKCYSYDRSNFPGGGWIEYFNPTDFAVDHYCDTVSGDWSGNFMNWATMTRMDVVRKILYGGRRYEDRETHTLLERAYLPTDGHAFAKYYNGDDLGKLTPFGSAVTDTDQGGTDQGRTDQDKTDQDNNDGSDGYGGGITICNTTKPPEAGSSQNTNNRPLARIVRGNFKLWAANERWQCRFDKDAENKNVASESGIDASSNEPDSASDGLVDNGYGPDFQLHIQACKPGLIHPSDDNENCKRYPDGNYKPTGLLQEYGENESIHFGAITGSYDNHIRGGVLRKNIGPLDDEINSDDGTFKADPNSAVPSVGIIRTLDKFRIFGYKYADGTYSSGDSCGFREKGLDDDSCYSWGNPMGEIYAEAVRYFAGLSKTSDFDANDNPFIGGLAEENWEDPLDSDNFCSGLNIVMINSGLSTYDADQASVFDDIASLGAESLTDVIGDKEGITGGDYFIGGFSGVNSDELCTAKTVNKLGDVRGQCPEGPTLEGSYLVSGMAHYARTQDIRDDLDGDQTIKTYAVQLSTDVPRMRIPVPTTGNEVVIIPAIQLSNGDGDPKTGTKAAGTLVDFQIVQPHVEISRTLSAEYGGRSVDTSNPNDCTAAEPSPGSGLFCGKYYSNHEVSEAGGDYDQDLWGTLTYYLDTKAGPTATVEIVTDLFAKSSGASVLYGFISSGTNADGFHAYSGMNGAEYEDPDPSVFDCAASAGDGDCDTDDGPNSHIFTVAPGKAQFLPDPLFLAAKYGGFEDSNANGIPDVDSEWDIRDTSGNSITGGDGIPDTFFYVTNPSALEDALRAVFDPITEEATSGTAATVVASEQEGSGALFQALYDPIKTDALGNEAKWIGTLHAIFVDPEGFLREDSNDNDKLDGYSTDKVIEIFFDENERRARLRRFSSSEDEIFSQDGSTVGELETLNPIWNAREQLSAISDVTQQRTYGAPADTGRHVLTWLDDNFDGIVGSGEVVDFDTTSITSSNYGWLDVWDGVATDDTEADKLIDFVRGEEQNGYRSRTVDYDNDGSLDVMRLGDIVHSTPTFQGAPAEAFDILSLDLSYAEFRTQYADRRNVVYVGANDGMIHAFNGGFYNAAENSFNTSLNSEVAHPLGSELWAYIPKNLLGHLQWLADENYTHVFYNDLKPFIFDAKIFDEDSTHPNGWGTVLVVGMRFGGGHDGNGILLDTAHDGSTSLASDNDVLTKSAYTLLDITDPEQPPTLIAEISPPSVYHTTSYPAAVVMGGPDDGSASERERTPSELCDGGKTDPIRPPSDRTEDDEEKQEKNKNKKDKKGKKGKKGKKDKKNKKNNRSDDDRAQSTSATAATGSSERAESTGTSSSTNQDGPCDSDSAETEANNWYLVFGSGPTNLGAIDSDQSARLFAYDLRELVLGNSGVIESGPFDSDGDTSNGSGYADTGQADAFVGEITVADQDLDMKAEALYFGTIGDDASDRGSLWRLSMGELLKPESEDSGKKWGAPFKLLDVDQPFSSRPAITVDSQFRTWILAGTGRLYGSGDKNSTEKQTLYGFRDPNDMFDNSATAAASHGSFEDVTSAVTFADGQVDLDGDGSYDTTYEAFKGDVDAAGGWFLNYNYDPSNIFPSERTVSNLALIGGIVFTSAFEPATDLCGAEGESRIIGRGFDSGLVPPRGIFGQVCDGCPDGNAEAIGSVDLGPGLASSPSIHIGNQDIPGKVTVVVQQTTADITAEEAQTTGGLNNGEVSWQEFRAE